MLGWLRGKAELRRTGHQLYERIVAQAREPSLYERCGVPDTMEGRLEMILLHVVLVLERLKSEGPTGQRLGQQVMERLVAEMDDALRRVGYGDDGVAGRLPRLGAALSERAQDYGAAFSAEAGQPRDALETALLAHVYRPVDAVASSVAIPLALRLADYVRQARSLLAATRSAELIAGRVAFPPVLAATPSGTTMATGDQRR